jgi:hypothetical protein
MKRALILAAALAALVEFALPARQAQASVSVGVSIGSGRHGGFSLSFASRPNVVLIPSSRVYYAPDLDEDLYAYDDEWYYCDEGTWYVADSYDGPFVAIGFASVPFEIRNVPGHYRRHWGDSSGYYGNSGYSGHSGYYGNSGYSGYSGYSRDTRYRSTYRPPVVTTPTYGYGDRNRTWSNRDQGNQTQWNGDRNRTWSNRDQGNQTQWNGDRNRTWSDRDQGNQTQWNGDRNDRGNDQGGNRGNGHGRGNQGHGRGQGQGHGRWGW